MGTIGALVVVVGWIICVVAWVMLLIAAFKEHILWGLGCLFIPFVSFIFIIINWDKARNPFFMWIVGVLLVFLGVALGGAMYPHMHGGGGQ